jgi:hypothetical protein
VAVEEGGRLVYAEVEEIHPPLSNSGVRDVCVRTGGSLPSPLPSTRLRFFPRAWSDNPPLDSAKDISDVFAPTGGVVMQSSKQKVVETRAQEVRLEGGGSTAVAEARRLDFEGEVAEILALLARVGVRLEKDGGGGLKIRKALEDQRLVKVLGSVRKHHSFFDLLLFAQNHKRIFFSKACQCC